MIKFGVIMNIRFRGLESITCQVLSSTFA